MIRAIHTSRTVKTTLALALLAIPGFAQEEAWTSCAREGQACEFSGTYTVRYGSGGNYETKTFTDGVVCNAASFGRDPNPRRRDRCHYDANSGHAGHDMPMPPHDMGDMSGMGPYIDTSAIPAPRPGFSTERVQSTSELPSPTYDGTGLFRTVCDFSHMNFDDAIVKPGETGTSHLHTYFGNTSSNGFSTAASLRSSGDSTCRGGTVNRSSYWVPALVDGAGKPIVPEQLLMYYKSGYSIPAAQIRPFPEGLRVVGGDAKSTSAQQHAYWGCHENYIGHPATIPDCGVGNHVVMTVVLPQCWDGVNLDSADHKSHLAYPQGNSCPSSHPVAIPEVTLNVLYKQTGSVRDWRLVSDMYDSSMPAGYSAHADWFAAWDPEVVASFVEQCINPQVDCHAHLLGPNRMIY